MTDFEQLIRAARAALPGETAAVQVIADRRCRQELDVIGRMIEAMDEVEVAFDSDSDSAAFDAEQLSRVREAFGEIAALALSQLALLRAQHPGDATSPAAEARAPEPGR